MTAADNEHSARQQFADALRELAQPACEPLLAALAGIADAPAPAHIERLRRTWSAPVVAAAVELQWARTRAATKFGARAASMWVDRAGVEMASSPAAAAWKARRYGGDNPVLDACCGIGGDLMELARVSRATGIDLDSARAWMAQRNAGVGVECGDALAVGGDAGAVRGGAGARARVTAGTLVHADPGRRDAGRRLLRASELQPPLAALRAACSAARGVGIKLGPGMDLAPADLTPGDELEFLSEDGTLTQQVLWSGALALHAGLRTATQVRSGLTLSGAAGPTPCSHDGRWLQMIADPCPALERARLLHLVAGAAREPAPGLGILTADSIPASPWLQVHAVVAQLPPRERAVADWLRAHGGGVPTIRTRGKACDPDAWQAALRGPGSAQHTVWILRAGEAVTALVTEPAPPVSTQP